MNNLSLIISKIEEFAPPGLAEEWDNSGWQVYLGNNQIKKVMLALSPTIDVIESAVKEGCELLITHHPLLFSGIKTISAENYANLPLIKAMQSNLQVYCAHTNLDSTQGGIADVLAKMLGLNKVCPIEGTDETGLGRKGELCQPENLAGFIRKLKQILNTGQLKLINPGNIEKVRTIGLLPGSGGSFIPSLKGIDLYVTGDVKYHEALMVNDFAVIDAGHFETEKIILPVLKDLLSEFNAEILIAREKLPWEIITCE